MKEIKIEIKKVINFLINNTNNGEKLLLDYLAIIYLDLKKLNNNRYFEECKILEKFFESLELYPKIDKEGYISYKKVENKEKNKKETFFKKKKINLSKEKLSGEENLLQDILFLTIFNNF